MNIEAEKWIVNGDAYYKVIKVKKCCDELIYNDGYIDMVSDYSDDYEINLIKTELVYLGDGIDDSVHNYKPIQYCPFCSEKINVNIVKTIDKTKDYEKLEKTRTKLYELKNETDSKKESKEFQNQIDIVCKKMNNMVSNDNFGMIKKKGLI